MRYLSRALLTASIVAVAIAFLASPASAAETSNSEFVIIPAEDVVADDLYAGAIRVVVEGTLDGDLIAFAGEEVVINGLVTGSVFALAPQVTINGRVDGSVRASGSSIVVNGSVGRDVVSAAFAIEFGADSQVAGDVLAWGWNVEARGSIGADLGGSMRALELAGMVDGDVEVSVGSLTVVDDLRVGGDLGYRSMTDAEGLDMAQVGGATVHETPLPPNIRVRALGWLGRLMIVLFLTTAGLAVAYGWPNRTSQAVSVVSARPVRSWVLGMSLFLTPLLIALIGALIFNLAPASAAFPLLAIIAPVVLALMGLTFAVAVVAGVPAVAWIGGVLFKKLDLFGAILVGGLIAGVIWVLPLIGLVAPLVVLPLGLGGWVLGRNQETAAVA